MAAETPKLKLLRIQEDWQFADEAFNDFIDDADDKLLGIDHADSPAHWAVWEPSKSYATGDIVRITNGKSHQYYQCITAGTSGETEPRNNVTGSLVISDGDIEWMVKSLSDENSSSAIKIWLSGENYIRGDCVMYGTALYRCKTKHTASEWNNDNGYWQEIFASIRLWKRGIYYYQDDTVVYNSVIYKCKASHMSAINFDATEEGYWEALNDGRILDWKPSTEYKIDDIVCYNSGYNWVLYRCIVDHTSDSSSFSADRGTKWKLFHTPSATLENWRANNYYEVGQCVLNSSRFYRCLTSHTSEVSWEDDKDNWMIIYSNLKDWTSNYAYHAGETVVHDGRLYRANTDHLSTQFIDDIAYWDKILIDGIQPWITDYLYQEGDIVYYDNVLYVCIAGHTSTTFRADRSNWKIFHKPSATLLTWTNNTYYEEGQLILYNDTLYKCVSTHNSSSDFDTDRGRWDIVYSNLKIWVSGKTYKEGSTVIQYGNIYRCKTVHLSNDFDDETENAYWELVSGGDTAILQWEPDTDYNQGDLIVYDGTLYEADNDFMSGNTFDDNNLTPIMGEHMTDDDIDDLWL